MTVDLASFIFQKYKKMQLSGESPLSGPLYHLHCSTLHTKDARIHTNTFTQKLHLENYITSLSSQN